VKTQSGAFHPAVRLRTSALAAAVLGVACLWPVPAGAQVPGGCSQSNIMTSHNRFPADPNIWPDGHAIAVTRVFGSGEPADYDSTGVPLSRSEWVAGSLIDPTGNLEVNVHVDLSRAYYAALLTTQTANLGLQLTGDAAFWLDPSEVTAAPGAYGPLQLQVQVKLNGVAVGRPISLPPIPVTDQDYGHDFPYCLTVKTDAVPLAVARKSSDSFTCPTASPDVNIKTCPGINEITLEVRNSPASAFLNVAGRPIAIYLDGMAPVVLIPGSGGETSAYWNDEDVGVTFEQTLRTEKVPYRHLLDPGKYLSGPASEYFPGAYSERLSAPKNVAEGIRSAGLAFGAKWVHLVGHSKGGLNARYWLGPTGRQGLSNSPGALSLITINTPHQGAVLASLVDMVAHDSYQAGGLESRPQQALALRVTQENRIHSMFDLTPERVDLFNSKQPLPSTSVVSNVSRRLVYRATSMDANRDTSGDGSGEFGHRKISVEEARAITPAEYRNYFGRIALADMFEDMYNYLGRATAVNCLVTHRVGDMGVIHWIHVAELALDSPHWQLNDFVVTTDSQRYANRRFWSGGSYTPLPSLTPPGLLHEPSIGAEGRNHSDVADSATAAAVLQSIRGLR
jgi:hypothetical protein